jgi:hypothetical protein
MSAPDLETLFDFETQFENAASGFLSNIATCFTMLDQSSMTTPRLEITCEIGEAVDPPDPKETGSAELEYRKYEATLNVDVVSDGSQSGSESFHRSQRAKVRAAMLRNASNFSSENLPYYDVKYIRPLRVQYSMDGDLLVSGVSFQIKFAIRNDAWPQN